MTKETTLFAIIFAIMFFIATETSFAQGPCLLGIGNCTNTLQITPNNVDPGKRMVHVTDYRAAEIYYAKQKNQKYLITLQAYSENGLLCEERAWIGGNYSGDATQVVVDVGATKKVCYDPQKPFHSSQQVNQFERDVDYFVNLTYEWEKYAEKCVVYINKYRDNARAVAYGQSELARAQYAITYYRNSITNYRTLIDQIAP